MVDQRSRRLRGNCDRNVRHRDRAIRQNDEDEMKNNYITSIYWGESEMEKRRHLSPLFRAKKCLAAWCIFFFINRLFHGILFLYNSFVQDGGEKWQ